MVQRAVVEEEEKIKDTHEIATADRAKKVAVTAAEQEAQEALVKEIKQAEAGRDAARFQAEEQVISAQAQRDAAEKETAAKKMLAEGITAEEAAMGLAEATVIEKKAVAEAHGIEAKADAIEKKGTAEANVLERTAVAEAKGQEAKAVAIEKQGVAEAGVIEQKQLAEATGITEKAKAMKILNEAGQGHEEFKLRLAKEKDVEIAAIQAQQDIASSQAEIVSRALQSAHIDIVGGEAEFFDKITTSIAAGKTIDRFVGNSQVLTDVKNTFFNGDPDYFTNRIGELASKFEFGSEDVKNLSIAALIAKMMGMTDDEGLLKELQNVLGNVRVAGLSDNPVSTLKLK